MPDIPIIGEVEPEEVEPQTLEELHEYLGKKNGELIRMIGAEGGALPAPHPFIIGRLEALVEVVFAMIEGEEARARFEVLTEKKINDQLKRYLAMVRRAKLKL